MLYLCTPPVCVLFGGESRYISFLQTMQHCLHVPYLIFSFVFWTEVACTIILFLCVSAVLRSFELDEAFWANLTVMEW